MKKKLQRSTIIARLCALALLGALLAAVLCGCLEGAAKNEGTADTSGREPDPTSVSTLPKPESTTPSTDAETSAPETSATDTDDFIPGETDDEYTKRY